MKLIIILVILLFIIFLVLQKRRKIEHFKFPKLNVDNVFNGKKVITSNANQPYFIIPKGYNTNTKVLNDFWISRKFYRIYKIK